jgi:hypothetical protein
LRLCCFPSAPVHVPTVANRSPHFFIMAVTIPARRR